MKKTLLLLVTGLVLSAGSFAQSVVITLPGSVTNISGQTEVEIVTTAIANGHLVDFHVFNATAGVLDMAVTRRIMNQTAGWSNYFCWGTTNGSGVAYGNCYPASADEYYYSDIYPVDAGDTAILNTYATIPTAGTATYRYYFTVGGVNIDSVVLQINSIVSLDEVAPILSVNVAPNPASDYVKVTAQGVGKASVRIIDILGNVIMTSTINESKIIDVTEFRNGIYFIIVESGGVKAVNRKVIVRH